ncbi:MAG TPA: hypothetical protein VNF99_04960 [Stellaceae bacterium]|nr:hypothetical protein [Stellaceae bacterium]
MNRAYLRAGLAVSAVAAVVLIAAAPPARADADLAKEMATAANHAGLAAKSTNMKMTQMHLHHVVNCLVGPSGAGFDAAPGNPCKDQGTGAIPDTKDAAQKAQLQQALAKAKAGLAETDMSAAQKDATAAQALLTPKAM